MERQKDLIERIEKLEKEVEELRREKATLLQFFNALKTSIDAFAGRSDTT